MENRKMILSSEVTNIEMILREKILNLQLSEDLLENYAKKHIYIWDKLNEEFISRLKLAVYKKDEICLDNFAKELPLLRRKLRNLPLRLVNNFAKSANIFCNYSNNPVLLNWENYAIEPLGAGWPNNKEYIEKLETIVKNSKLDYTVSIDDIKLSMYTFELYNLYEKQLYNKTFDNMQKIVNIL